MGLLGAQARREEVSKSQGGHAGAVHLKLRWRFKDPLVNTASALCSLLTEGAAASDSEGHRQSIGLFPGLDNTMSKMTLGFPLISPFTH